MPSNVLEFRSRPPKQARWVGPIAAERERCIAIFTSEAAQGAWAEAAKVLARSTDDTAAAIVEKLSEWRTASRAELLAELARETFSKSRAQGETVHS